MFPKRLLALILFAALAVMHKLFNVFPSVRFEKKIGLNL
jgi:hypothetical protein